MVDKIGVIGVSCGVILTELLEIGRMVGFVGEEAGVVTDVIIWEAVVFVCEGAETGDGIEQVEVLREENSELICSETCAEGF